MSILIDLTIHKYLYSTVTLYCKQWHQLLSIGHRDTSHSLLYTVTPVTLYSTQWPSTVTPVTLYCTQWHQSPSIVHSDPTIEGDCTITAANQICTPIPQYLLANYPVHTCTTGWALWTGLVLKVTNFCKFQWNLCIINNFSNGRLPKLSQWTNFTHMGTTTFKSDYMYIIHVASVLNFKNNKERKWPLNE